MGLQGDKATHDFLSLYSSAAANDSTLPAPPLLQESKNAAPAPSQGFLLKTHDFLQPRGSPSSSPSRQQPAAVKPLNKRRHAVPAGVVGTFSIISRPAPPAADLPGGAVKQETEPALFALWGQPEPRAHPWPQPQPQMPPERKACGGGFTDAVSRSSGDGDDDGRAARREVSSSSLKELRVETKGGGSCSGSAGTDQLPNSPRSKHSATEQRRRSKINDRFQVLREILPQNDQKRDKASFLLEVIEYIRFLQERAQKYEASHREWNQENSKVMPWSNIYFRSFWKNGQNKDDINGDTTSDPSQVIRNGSPLGFPFALKPGDGNNAAAFETASGGQELAGANQKHRVSYNEADTPSNVPNNVASQQPAQPTESLPTKDREVNKELLKDPELAIDEGTISVSSQYSQGLLATLNHALQNSGIDLSEASISVQINLGKRAIKGPTPGANCSSKEELTDQASRNQAIWHQRESGNGALEHPQATKRRKSDR